MNMLYANSPRVSSKTSNNAASSVRRKYSAAVYPFLCCAIVLLCLAVAQPFANSAFNDDWSYSYVALKFAETGRLHYSGWGSPMILFQTVWGAAWIRVFGFSFNVLRAATVPFSLGFVVLVYALGRKLGLERTFALFGAIAIGTSPLFLPLAASFMTESYGCFFGTLCLYAAIASAQTPNRPQARCWLWVLAISGILGGSNRQLIWAAPLSLIPYVWWLKRSDRRFTLHAAAAGVFCIASAAFLLARLSQPYAPLQLSRAQLFGVAVDNGGIACALLSNLSLSCLLAALPAFICFTPFWGRLGILRLTQYGIVCAMFMALLVCLFGTRYGLAPFLGNMLTPYGILNPGEDALGGRPVILPIGVRSGITWLLLISVAAAIRITRKHRPCLERVPLTVLALFSASYIPFVLPGAVVGLVFDRYMLPLLPALIVIGLLTVRSMSCTVPVSAWVCLILFAGYSTVTTHDYFSYLRARVLAARNLETRGIPRREISAGVEYDGWTELQLAGTIKPILYNDVRPGRTTETFWFWEKTVTVKPRYVISYCAPSDVPAAAITTVPIETWLPPRRWAAVGVRRADLDRVIRR